MAVRGSTKQRSVAQEDKIAKLYRGTRSPSSGAAASDQGDVRTQTTLIECKYTGGPEHDAKRLAEGKPLKRSTLLKTFEKIWQEAVSEGRSPAICLREWAPESRLAKDGWVDLIVRPVEEDAEAYDPYGG